VSRYQITIKGAADRDRVKKYVDAAPSGTRIEIKSAKRSMAQNDKMWAMLTEIAEQVKWHGVRLRPDDWKLLFLDALKREIRMLPNLEGDGFVAVDRSTSDLSKEEMSDLIELMYKFGAEETHPVKFQDPQ
jgi:hypothetical protein